MIKAILTLSFFILTYHDKVLSWSGQQDSNLRHYAPKAYTLARLSYTPMSKSPPNGGNGHGTFTLTPKGA